MNPLVGRLIIAGFSGTILTPALAKRLAANEVGGVVLFRRNIETVHQLHALCAEIATATRGHAWIGVDQEGGRVARVPFPVLKLPPARLLGQGSSELLGQVGAVLGSQLAALGFNLNFAPVLDVDSNPDNPVIGDRSFSSVPSRVAELGCAFALGLQAAGVLACAKHFPGHGDTHQDSHKVLPQVDRSTDELTRVEIVPFAAAITAGVAAVMSAHVIYSSWDTDCPATLSAKIMTDLLRKQLGFSGIVFSDDLEMSAIMNSRSIEEAAVEAVAAGCDALLICHSEERQERARLALAQECERSPAFLARVDEALERQRQLLRRYPAGAYASTEQLLTQLKTRATNALTLELQRLGDIHTQLKDPTDR